MGHYVVVLCIYRIRLIDRYWDVRFAVQLLLISFFFGVPSFGSACEDLHVFDLVKMAAMFASFARKEEQKRKL